jgi:hypothetical protein
MSYLQLPHVAINPEGGLVLQVEIDGKVHSAPMTIERAIRFVAHARQMIDAAECIERQDALSGLEIEAGRSDRELKLVQGGRS